MWARHPCRETPTNSTAPYPRACRDSHSPPVAAALLSARSIEDNVTKPSLFVSNALNSFVKASTTAVFELSVSWPKRGAGTTAGCRQLTAGATAPLTTRDEEATSAVAAAHRTSISRADGMRPNYFRSDHRGAESSGQFRQQQFPSFSQLCSQLRPRAAGADSPTQLLLLPYWRRPRWSAGTILRRLPVRLTRVAVGAAAGVILGARAAACAVLPHVARVEDALAARRPSRATRRSRGRVWRARRSGLPGRRWCRRGVGGGERRVSRRHPLDAVRLRHRWRAKAGRRAPSPHEALVGAACARECRASVERGRGLDHACACARTARASNRN